MERKSERMKTAEVSPFNSFFLTFCEPWLAGMTHPSVSQFFITERRVWRCKTKFSTPKSHTHEGIVRSNCEDRVSKKVKRKSRATDLKPLDTETGYGAGAHPQRESEQSCSLLGLAQAARVDSIDQRGCRT